MLCDSKGIIYFNQQLDKDKWTTFDAKEKSRLILNWTEQHANLTSLLEIARASRKAELNEAHSDLLDMSSNIWGNSHKIFLASQICSPAVKKKYTNGIDELVQRFKSGCVALLNEASFTWPAASNFQKELDEKRKQNITLIREKAKEVLAMMCENDADRLEDAVALLSLVVERNATKLDNCDSSVGIFLGLQEDRTREIEVQLQVMEENLRVALTALRSQLQIDTDTECRLSEKKRKADDDKKAKATRECRNPKCGQKRLECVMTSCPHSKLHDSTRGYWFCKDNANDCASVYQHHLTPGNCHFTRE